MCSEVYFFFFTFQWQVLFSFRVWIPIFLRKPLNLPRWISFCPMLYIAEMFSSWRRGRGLWSAMEGWDQMVKAIPLVGKKRCRLEQQGSDVLSDLGMGCGELASFRSLACFPVICSDVQWPLLGTVSHWLLVLHTNSDLSVTVELLLSLNWVQGPERMINLIVLLQFIGHWTGYWCLNFFHRLFLQEPLRCRQIM